MTAQKPTRTKRPRARKPHQAAPARPAANAAVAEQRAFPEIDLYSLGLAAILVVAAALRFYDLDRTSIWIDEAMSWSQARQPFYDMLVATAQDVHPPLHNIILHATIALFGDSETALRAPSALLGVGAVYLLYRLGEALWDRETGLVAALLLALSGFHVWYSTEARDYALLTFTSILFMLAVVHAARTPNWKTLAACAAAGTLLLYSHPYGGFVFGGVNLFVLGALLRRAPWIKAAWWQWIVGQAVPSILFLPWAIIILKKNSPSWIPEPTAAFVFHELPSLVGGGLALGVFGILASFALIDSASMRTRKGSKASSWLNIDWQTGLILVWALTPLLAGYLISVVDRPILVPRYLICSMPAILLLASRGVLSLRDVRAVALALLIAIAVSIPDLKQKAFETMRENNRDAARDFAARYISSDIVVIAGSPRAFQYYYRGAVPDLRSYEEVTSPETLTADRVWLVSRSTKRLKEPIARFLSKVNQSYRIVFSRKSPPLYLFERIDSAPQP